MRDARQTPPGRDSSDAICGQLPSMIHSPKLWSSASSGISRCSLTRRSARVVSRASSHSLAGALSLSRLPTALTHTPFGGLSTTNRSKKFGGQLTICGPSIVALSTASRRPKSAVNRATSAAAGEPSAATNKESVPLVIRRRPIKPNVNKSYGNRAGDPGERNGSTAPK